MATKIYTAAETEVLGGITVHRVTTAAVKVSRGTDGLFTVTAEQSEIDIIDALGTWTAQ